MYYTLTKMKRFPFFVVLVCAGYLMMGADGCSSDPNVEGAKLDLRNKDYDRALENLQTAIETDPSNGEAYALQAQVYQEQAAEMPEVDAHTEIVNKMMSSFQKALELTPPDAHADLIQRLKLAWYNEYQRGAGAYSGQRFDDAITYFENASRIQPDSSGTYVNLAYAYISAQRSSEAIGPLEMAIEKGDKQADTYNYLSDLYMENNRGEEAVTLLEKARMIFPENTDVMARLFNSYIATGQTDRAVEVASNEVQKNPSDARLRYNYGSLLLQANQFDGAIEQLARAAELDPDYTAAHFNLGAAYQNKAVNVNDLISEADDKLRNEKDSLSEQEQARMQEQIDGWVKDRDDLFQQSIPHLEKARMQTEANGDSASDICGALGQAYARVNQMEKAEEAFKCAEGN
jgi:tetratricopeptide (TPR) repeat protein